MFKVVLIIFHSKKVGQQRNWVRTDKELGKQGTIEKMSEMLKILSVQNMQRQFETLWKKAQFSKDFRTDGARISKI